MSKKLFRLIKALNPTEKAHFKKISGENSEGRKKYVDLFDTIEKMEIYEPSVLKRSFKRYQTKKDITGYLGYLFGNIMDSLKIYHARKSVDSQINHLLQDAELLFSKGFYPEALKTIAKAKKEAQIHERFLLLMEANALELKMAGNQIDLKLMQKIINKGRRDQYKILNILKITGEYEWLRNRIFYINKRAGIHIKNKKEIEKLETIMKHPLLTSEKKTVSVSTKDLYYTIHSSYNFIKIQQDIPKSIYYVQKRKELMERNPEWTSERISVYLTVLYNLCGRYVTTGELTKLDSIVEQLNGIPEKFGSKVTKEDEKWRTAIMQNLFMYRCIITGEFEKGINIINNQEDEWEKNQVKISTEYLLVFYSNMYILYWGIADFKKALFWNNKTLNREGPVRTDNYINAMIRNIIIHYELGHFDRINPLAKTTLHFLNKERMPYLFQRFFIKSIQNMSNVNYENKEEYKNTISTFKKKLIVLKNQTPELMELDYKLYMAWLDTHIERKKITETYKKYLKLR